MKVHRRDGWEVREKLFVVIFYSVFKEGQYQRMHVCLREWRSGELLMQDRGHKCRSPVLSKHEEEGIRWEGNCPLIGRK